jgi:chromosomal replication initiation ATPase DnaA
MNELGLAYIRGAKGPIGLKQESEMLHLRKRVHELEGLLQEAKEGTPNNTLFPWPFLAPPVAYLPPDEPMRPTKDKITDVVRRFYKLSLREIMSERRHQEVTFPRQVAMYLCCEHTLWSLTSIGKYFGGKDHTTVLHSQRKIQGLIGTNAEITQQINEIERLLRVDS